MADMEDIRNFIESDGDLKGLCPCVEGILSSGSEKGPGLILILAEMMAERTDIPFEYGDPGTVEAAYPVLGRMLAGRDDTGFVRFVKLDSGKPAWAVRKRGDPRDTGIYF